MPPEEKRDLFQRIPSVDRLLNSPVVADLLLHYPRRVVLKAVHQVLEEIRSGAFAEEWEAEQKAGLPVFRQLRELREQHPIAEWERKTRKAFRMGPV